MQIPRFILGIDDGIEEKLVEEIRECLASAVFWASVNAEVDVEGGDYFDEIPIKGNTLVERTLLTMHKYAKHGIWKKEMFSDESDIFHVYLYVIQSRYATELTDGCAATPDWSEAVINMYLARLKLDDLNGRKVGSYRDSVCGLYIDEEYGQGMTVPELAMLSSMQMQSIYNVIGKEGGLKRLPDNTGKVAVICPKSALEWLERKDSFVKTTIEGEEEVLIDREKQVALVPIAKDGSAFDYSCYRKTGFRIGKKGEEYAVENYREALEQLRKMKKAYWRRPNKNGIFGIVTAVKWEHRSFLELGIR